MQHSEQIGPKFPEQCTPILNLRREEDLVTSSILLKSKLNIKLMSSQFQGKCCPSAGLRASHCAENKLADSNDSCGKDATEENVPTFLAADNRSSHPPEHRPAQVRGRGAAPRARLGLGKQNKAKAFEEKPKEGCLKIRLN